MVHRRKRERRRIFLWLRQVGVGDEYGPVLDPVLHIVRLFPRERRGHLLPRVRPAEHVAGTRDRCTAGIVAKQPHAALHRDRAAPRRHGVALHNRGEPRPGEDEFGRPPRVSATRPGVADSELTAIRLQPAPNARSCVASHVLLARLGFKVIGTPYFAGTRLLHP